MAKGRKGKKGKKAGKYTLSNVMMHYKQKNYSTALRQLRACNIREHEQEKADWLYSFLPVAIAYQHFAVFEYRKVIELLEKTSDNSDKKILLLGLSYLYTGHFQRAEEYLEKTVQYQKKSLFGFYYLMAIVYGGKVEKEDDFFEKYADIINDLDEERRRYLQFFIALMNGNVAVAKEYLNHFKTRNTNFKLLKYLLGNTKPNGKFTETKGLYKVLVKLPHSLVEAAYLKTFPILQEELEGAKKATLRKEYQEDIIGLCVKGIPVGESTFDHLYKEVPAALKAKLIYNQVVAYYNEGERSFKFIRKQIDENAASFFKVQESLDVYLATFDVEEDYEDYRCIYFWRNINYYFENFHEIYAPEVLNKIAWKVYDVIDMLEIHFLDKKNGARFLREFNKKYNSIAALQFKDISLVFVFRDYRPAEASFAIFSNAYFEDYMKIILQELEIILDRTNLERLEEEMTRVTEEHGLPTPYSMIKGEALKIHIAELNESYDAIYKAFEKHDIHPKNVSVVEVMDMLTLNLKNLIIKRPEANIETLKPRGLAVYEKIFETFPQIKREDSEEATLKNIEKLPALLKEVEEAVLNDDLSFIKPYLDSDLLPFLTTYLFLETLPDAEEEVKRNTIFIEYLDILAEKEKFDEISNFLNNNFEKQLLPRILIIITLLLPILNGKVINIRLLIFIIKPCLGLLTDEEHLDKNLPIIQEVFKILTPPILADDLSEDEKKIVERLLDYIKKMGEKHKIKNSIKQQQKKLSKALLKFPQND